MPSSNFVVEQPITPKEFETYYQLRYEVLRKPWNQPPGSELDETDNTSTHAFIKNNDIAIACARLLFVDDEIAQVRSMAVHPAYQQKGLGKLVLTYLEEVAQKNNRLKVILHARENALKFYEKCGYNRKEKSYLLFGEIQHYLMEKSFYPSLFRRTPCYHNEMRSP
ncbi:MAG: GNAT family N-acetyltransferase [Bacteroidia bacterium]